ncbi:MAG: TetR family transcriptional regulator [Stackebrandtia sp.]
MNTPGLRERKKLKTRKAIQDNAERLFTEKGYEATTTEQIAAAAEVSPSTFFRYFRTKEDVVVGEEYDPVMLDAVKNMPGDMEPLAGLRAAVPAALGRYPAEDEQILAFTKLAFDVPGISARRMEHAYNTQRMIAETLTERLGRDGDDLEVHTFAAAVTGAWSSALYVWARNDGRQDLAELVDRALALLESRLRL